MFRNLVRRASIVVTLFLFPLGSTATTDVPVEGGDDCMLWYGGICGCAWVQTCPEPHEPCDPKTGACWEDTDQ